MSLDTECGLSDEKIDGRIGKWHDWEEIARLTRMGYSVRFIARSLHCSERTVNRARKEHGLIKEESNRRMTDAQAAEALSLLKKGYTYAETGRKVGFARRTIRLRFPEYANNWKARQRP